MASAKEKAEAERRRRQADRRAAAPPPKPKAGPPSGTPLTPSEKLAEIVGAAKITLQAANKKVWLYIKSKKLQDVHTPRLINPDATLKKIVVPKVVDGKPLTTYIMTRCVREHLS
jgi:chromatin remodeling complex protein RSC6